MCTDRSELTTPPRRLPALSLPPVSGGEPLRLRRPSRKAPVLVLVHGLDCAACRAHIADLARHHGAIAEWDGELRVVTPEASARDDGPDGKDAVPFPVLSDSRGQLASALSIEAPATIVADQWGEIHALERAGPEHRFPAPSEVIDWVRFLAVQCPECQGEAF